jgi:hypothetical protein
VVLEAATPSEEYAQVARIETTDPVSGASRGVHDRIYFTTPLRYDHAFGATIQECTLAARREGTDYTLVSMACAGRAVPGGLHAGYRGLRGDRASRRRLDRNADRRRHLQGRHVGQHRFHGHAGGRADDHGRVEQHRDRQHHLSQDAPLYAFNGWYIGPTPRMTVDFRTMLHRIHRGRELASGASYTANGIFLGTPYPVHYAEIGFPAMPGGAGCSRRRGTIHRRQSRRCAHGGRRASAVTIPRRRPHMPRR